MLVSELEEGNPPLAVYEEKGTSMKYVKVQLCYITTALAFTANWKQQPNGVPLHALVRTMATQWLSAIIIHIIDTFVSRDCVRDYNLKVSLEIQYK